MNDNIYELKQRVANLENFIKNYFFLGVDVGYIKDETLVIIAAEQPHPILKILHLPPGYVKDVLGLLNSFPIRTDVVDADRSTQRWLRQNLDK